MAFAAHKQSNKKNAERLYFLFGPGSVLGKSKTGPFISFIIKI